MTVLAAKATLPLHWAAATGWTNMCERRKTETTTLLRAHAIFCKPQEAHRIWRYKRQTVTALARHTSPQAEAMAGESAIREILTSGLAGFMQLNAQKRYAWGLNECCFLSD